MSSDLRRGMSASDREGPLVTQVNGPLMARLYLVGLRQRPEGGARATRTAATRAANTVGLTAFLEASLPGPMSLTGLPWGTCVWCCTAN